MTQATSCPNCGSVEERAAGYFNVRFLEGNMNLKKGKNMNIRYAVYWDTAAAEGGIEEVDMDDIWTGENQSGWTYQHIGGPHDNYQGDYKSRKEAEEVLAALCAT